MAKVNRKSLVLLDEATPQQAMVRMKDGDTFFLAMEDAARACQAFDKKAAFQSQFDALMARLHAWISPNRSKIRSAHLTIRDRDVLFLVMQKDVRFDAALASALTELDLEIANSPDLSLIDMDVLAVPFVSDDSANAFLSSGTRYTYAK